MADRLSNERPTTDKFERNITDLVYWKGDTPPEIADERVQNIGRLALQPQSRRAQSLENILERGNGLAAEGKLNFDDWEKLAGVIYEERVNLGEPVGTGMGGLERLFPSPETRRLNLLDLMFRADRIEPIPPMHDITWDGLSEKETKFWIAGLKVAYARARKQAAILPKDLMPNPEMMSLTKEELTILTSTNKTAEIISIYLAIFKDNGSDKNGKNGFFDNAKERMGIDTLHPLDPSTSEAEIVRFREQFRGYLMEKFRLNDEQVVLGEYAAYNFVIMTNYFEEIEASREREKTVSIDKVVNLATRDMMNLKK